MRLFFLASLCFMPTFVQAQEILSEKDALAAFRSSNPQRQALRHAVDAADAQRRDARLYPNPELGWSRERLRTAGASATEDSLSLSFPLALSGRYGLARRAADLGYEERRGLIERELFELDNDFRLAFYSLLWSQERAQALREGVGRVRSLVQAIQGRGGSDSYDQLRLGIELSQAEADLEEAELRRLEAQGALQRYLSGASSGALKLQGVLSPSYPLLSSEALAMRARSRSDLTALERRGLRQEVLGRSAERAWLPPLTVAVGRKAIDEPGLRGSGWTAGLSLDLPLFNRGQALAARAGAERKAASAAEQDLRREIEALLRARHQAALGRRELTQRYGQTALRQAERLERAIGASYLEGKRTLLELLDAYGASLAVRLRALETAFEARKADLLLERLCGADLENQP